MKKSIRAAIGTIAFATPVVLGIGFTAGASVGANEADGSSHTVDQWSISQEGSGDYTLDREEVDGAVTLVITGPDGQVLLGEDVPDFVSDAADEFGDPDWEPETESPIEFIDGEFCYNAELVSDSSNDMQGSYGYLSISDNHTQGVELFADGRFEAVSFDRAISQEEITAVVENNGSYFDLEDAQVLPTCG